MAHTLPSAPHCLSNMSLGAQCAPRRRDVQVTAGGGGPLPLTLLGAP